MIISHVSYMLMIAQSLLMRQKKTLYLYSNVGTIFVFLEMYVFLIAFSLVNGWISHTLYYVSSIEAALRLPSLPQFLNPPTAKHSLLWRPTLNCFRSRA